MPPASPLAPGAYHKEPTMCHLHRDGVEGLMGHPLGLS